MALRQEITADKAGFLEYLDGLIADHVAAQNAAETVKGARYQSGVADGLRIARRAVDAWQVKS